jgi:mRNA interferase RelE/StbE
VYRVELTRRARDELDGVRGDDFERVVSALGRLSADPRPRGVKRLRGPIHRIRVGDWRVIYAVFDKDGLLIVGKIARRSERTYDSVEGLF